MSELKKYGAYVAVLMAGLLLGYVFFSENNSGAAHIHESTTESQDYTCAMHPQIHQDTMGDCPICGMDLVLSNASDNGLNRGEFQMTENAIALANIETTKIGIGNVEGNVLNLSGKITSNEKTNSVQTTDFDGRIEKLNVNSVGQYIKKGKNLGTIYSPDLYSAQDQMLTSVSYKETHEKLFAAARNNSGLWKLTDAQINDVIKSKKPISKFPITATVSGTVTEVMATVGNYYKEGDALFKVSNLYSVWAVFDAYENQLSLLKVGQDVTISSNAFNGKTFTAKIAFIDPILDANKRTVSLRATLINKEGLFKPGMFIDGKIEVNQTDQVLLVPKSAVLWTGRRSLVYLKPDSSQPIFEMTEVTLGNAIGNAYLVLDGLTPGDEIVTNGTFTVDAAAQLQGKKSMMSRIDNEIPLDDGNMRIKGNSNLKESFTRVLSLYDELKNALVNSNGTTASSDAKQMVSELNKLNGELLDGTTISHIKILKKQGELMAATQNITALRAAFKPFSDGMVAIASNLADLDQPIYVQHCPMANNNKGANWLSFQEEIKNPYFGDAMLTCGSVVQIIQ